MKKKTALLTIFGMLIFVCGLALASTYTTYYHLEKKADGASGWTESIRDNYDLIDAALNGIADGTAASYRNTYYPENYGTQGDGNDSDIVRLAYAAAVAAGGGEIYLGCDKDWVFNLTITANNIFLRGCNVSYGGTTDTIPSGGNPWTPADTSQPIIKIGDAQGSTKYRGIIIESFYMDGNDSGVGGIWHPQGSDVTVRDGTIKGMTKYGIKLGDENGTCGFDSDRVSYSDIAIYLGAQSGTTPNSGIEGVGYVGTYHFESPVFRNVQIWSNQGESIADQTLHAGIWNRGFSAVYDNVKIGCKRAIRLSEGRGTATTPGYMTTFNLYAECQPYSESCIVNEVNTYPPFYYIKGTWQATAYYELSDGSKVSMLNPGVNGWSHEAAFYRPVFNEGFVFNKLAFYGPMTTTTGYDGNSSTQVKYIRSNDSNANFEMACTNRGIDLIPDYANNYPVSIYNLYSPIWASFVNGDAAQGESLKVAATKDKYGIYAYSEAGAYNAVAIGANCASKWNCVEISDSNDTATANALSATAVAGSGVVANSSSGTPGVFTKTPATNNDVQTIITLRNFPADANGTTGEGVGVLFQAESDAGGQRDIAKIFSTVTDATDLGEDSSVTLQTVVNHTLTDGLVITGANARIPTGTLTVAGSSSGLTLEVDGHADGNLTSAQLANTVIYNTGMADGNTTLVLPDGAAGYRARFSAGTARAKYWGVQAKSADKIYLIAADGTFVAGSDHGKVVMVNAQVGQQFECWTFKTDAYDWACKAIAIGTSTFEAR